MVSSGPDSLFLGKCRHRKYGDHQECAARNYKN
jgi:hypothetical protein